MAQFKTHYDDLQVKENASDEVIKGAYRYLSQKWHPDRNPNNKQDAESVMIIINQAYAILSDPIKRKEHDEWIQKQKESESASTQSPPPPQRKEEYSTKPEMDEIQELIELLNEDAAQQAVCSMVKTLESVGYDRDSLVDLIADRGHYTLARDLDCLMTNC